MSVERVSSGIESLLLMLFEAGSCGSEMERKRAICEEDADHTGLRQLIDERHCVGNSGLVVLERVFIRNGQV